MAFSAIQLVAPYGVDVSPELRAALSPRFRCYGNARPSRHASSQWNLAYTDKRSAAYFSVNERSDPGPLFSSVYPERRSDCPRHHAALFPRRSATPDRPRRSITCLVRAAVPGRRVGTTYSVPRRP